MTAEQFIADVKATAEKATQGPWKSDQDGDVWTEAEKNVHEHIRNFGLFRTIGTTTTAPDPGNAAFIAASRTDVPKLVRMLEEAVKGLSRIMNNLDGQNDIICSETIAELTLSYLNDIANEGE